MTKFHHNYNVNQLLITGEYNDETYTANKILALIVDYYELGDDVAQALCLRYNTNEREQGKRRSCYYPQGAFIEEGEPATPNL
jgi:hypothetical protein